MYQIIEHYNVANFFFLIEIHISFCINNIDIRYQKISVSHKENIN